MKHLILVAILALFCGSIAGADTGHEGATRVEIGSYIETAVVAGTSVTGTAFITASVKRPDGVYFNNTSTTIWIGTTTATAQTNHSNTTIGFPVLSSATFRLSGSMTGTLAFTCSNGTGACEIRRLEGLVR